MHILRSIVKNIKKSSYYSIMADETTDIINKEQFVISIRWVENDLNTNEDFIGLHELSVTARSPVPCNLWSRVLQVSKV